MAASNSPVLCLDCGKPVKGRSDKKFCDDYCRNNYNNRLKSKSTNLMRNINNALSKNRRIIEQLMGPNEEMAKVHKDKLTEMGFHFKYCTHIYTNKRGNVYFYSYDRGYLPLEHDWYLLVKSKEEQVGINV